MATVKALFMEYANTLGFDLSFQNFNTELAELPGEYSEPSGCILIARIDSAIVGCVALRDLGSMVCEMKRLYVQPAFRGEGVGRQLAKSIIAEARSRGYREMKLDTVASMNQAIQLYNSLGFKQTAPYRHNPIQGAVFMQLELV